MATSELAITYAALILADESVDITSENLLAITKAAGVDVEPVWANLFAKALQGKDVKDMLTNVGAGGGGPAAAVAGSAAGGGASAAAAADEPKAEEKKEEAKEESDDDMGFGLFD